MTAAIQQVIILGATGNVGSEVVKQMVLLSGEKTANEWAFMTSREVCSARVAGLANSSHVMLLDEALRDELEQKVRGLSTSPAFDLQSFLREFLQRNGTVHGGDPEVLRVEINKALPVGNTVLMDATSLSGNSAIQIHKSSLADGHRVVTANKNPLSLGSYEEFRTLTCDRRKYGFGPTVMAGGGVIQWLQQAVTVGEQMTRIEGCFSGTLGYIATELEKGDRSFSTIVRDARVQKITEPHPWSDLSGLDVARKALILARICGMPLEMKDVAITPFIGKKFGEVENVEAFLDGIAAADEEMADRMEKAKTGGNTLRYVAEITEDGRLAVGLKEVSKNSLLGRVQGTLNIVTFVGGALAPADAPHTIVSKGAGVERTAAALRVGAADLVE